MSVARTPPPRRRALPPDVSVNHKHETRSCSLRARTAAEPLLKVPTSSVQTEAPRADSRIIYGRRWWICIVYSLMVFLQGMTWNTYGPISANFKAIYGWSDSTVALLPNIAGIVVTVLIAPASYMLFKVPIRTGMILTTFANAACTGLRCVPGRRDQHIKWCIASMVMNGISGSFNQVLPPMLSATWHPYDERTLATAIMMLFNYMGSAAGFIIGPLFVKQHSANIHDVQRLYYVQAIASAVVLLFALIYFPSKPPSPPSLSKEMESPPFGRGIHSLLMNPRFMLLAMVYGCPLGVAAGWSAMLGPNLLKHGFSQEQAGWLGFAVTMAGCVAGIFGGQLLDFPQLAKKKKATVILLYVLGAIGITLFAASCEGIIPAKRWILYSSCGLGGLALNAVIPVFYELCLEETFPISESSSTSVLVFMLNLFQTVFLSLPINKWGTAWMNWLFAGTMILAPISLLPFPERYRRLSVDLGESVTQP